MSPSLAPADPPPLQAASTRPAVAAAWTLGHGFRLSLALNLGAEAVAYADAPAVEPVFAIGDTATDGRIEAQLAQASPQAKVLSKPVHLRDLVNEVERMVAA